MLEGIYLRTSGVMFFVGAFLAGTALFVVTTTSSGIASLGPLGAPPLVVGIGMLLLVGIPIVGFYLVAGQWILSELANDTPSPTLETTVFVGVFAIYAVLKAANTLRP